MMRPLQLYGGPFKEIAVKSSGAGTAQRMKRGQRLRVAQKVNRLKKNCPDCCPDISISRIAWDIKQCRAGEKCWRSKAVEDQEGVQTM